MLLSNGTASDPRLDIYADDNVTRDAAVTTPVHGAKTPATLAPGLAIVILTLDRADLMLPLLATLDAARTRLNDHCPVDIIVGDTGSTAAELLAEYDRLADQVIVARNMRYHFSRCNNQLFNRHVRRELVLFLNNDVIFPDAADALAEENKSSNLSVKRLNLYFSYKNDSSISLNLVNLTLEL